MKLPDADDKEFTPLPDAPPPPVAANGAAVDRAPPL
jgi:hypothetical protein